MSKNFELYKRWLKTAKDDIEAAQWDYQGGFHEQVCFLCQQAVEKMLKAFLYLNGERDVWGHSTEQLCKLCEEYNSTLGRHLEILKKLDRYYIPTRYPNGLPSGTPRENYTKEDSDFALQTAKAIVEVIESLNTDL